MENMPRTRPPYIQREKNRHGTVVWYFRVGEGKRVRMPCGPGEPGFAEAYRLALNGEDPKAKPKDRSGTISWLVERYRDSSAWRKFSLATKKQREAIFAQIVTTAGHHPFVAVQRSTIIAGIDKRKDTPHQARHYLTALRGMFEWAVSAGITETDPTHGLKTERPRSKGFEAWDEADVAQYEARWPLGTRQRLAFDVLRYTGLRRGDAARLSVFHVRDRVIRIDTEKTDTRVTIPILPPLEASIAAGPVGETTFIASVLGKPLTKESFGNFFREWCTAAGISKSAHGIRKLAAATMAENGATVAELEAIFGWTGGDMASLYTRSANREAISLRAGSKLARTDAEQSIPAPSGKVRGAAKKDK